MQTLRVLKLMADYQCAPLWDCGADAVGNVEPSSLPLSASLIEALTGWAARYDATLNWANPIESGFSSSAEEAAHRAEAHHLAARLRSELGPGFEIVVQLH